MTADADAAQIPSPPPEPPPAGEEPAPAAPETAPAPVAEGRTAPAAPERDRGAAAAGARGRPRGRRPGGRRPPLFTPQEVERIDYKDVDRLRRLLSDRGKMEPRRKTGLLAKDQRKLAREIKRARHVALLPHTAAHMRATSEYRQAARAAARAREAPPPAAPAPAPQEDEVTAAPTPAQAPEPADASTPLAEGPDRAPEAAPEAEAALSPEAPINGAEIREEAPIAETPAMAPADPGVEDQGDAGDVPDEAVAASNGDDASGPEAATASTAEAAVEPDGAADVEPKESPP